MMGIQRETSTKLENMMGLEETPLIYVIAPVKPSRWTIFNTVNDLERLIYSVALMGVVFDRDNAKVWAVTK